MLYQERVAQKVQALPTPLARLVDLFIDFLLLRYRQSAVDNDLNTAVLTRIAATGGAFDWLDNSAEEGIYSDADGEPV